MGKFRESRTAKNLLTSFAGESQARNRYTYFARRASEEGFAQIAEIFEETANQECEHALRFFKFFNGGEMEITWSFPAGVIKGTYENLVAAADGERFEHSSMYPGFAGIARDEGYAGRRDLGSHQHLGKAARKALPGAGCQPQGRSGFQPRAGYGLALPQLWLPAHRQRGSGKVPGLREAPGIF